jgi:subtilase family serine protease
MKTESSRVSEPRFATVVSTALLSLMLFCGSAGAADQQVLRGHVPPAVAKLGLKPVGRLPATNQLRLAIGLPLRHTNELEQLLRNIYDPASPEFRNYLTPEQFTERFGPAQEDYEAVKRFAVQHGLEVTGTFSNRVVLDVMGQVSQIENALNIKLQSYQHPTEARQFYAPDVEPSVDAGLTVLDISGLDNYAIPRPALHRAAPSATASPAMGSGPGGSYIGRDLRNAYMPGTTGANLIGTGQMVGLVEFDGYSATDVATYEDKAGLPHVPLQHILIDGYNGATDGTTGELEADIDIEMAISLAPGLEKVVVFDEGPNAGYVWNDVLSRVAESNQVKQISASWVDGDNTHNATSDQLFKKMASQGQSFLQAAGDSDAWNNDPAMPYYHYTWPDKH